VRRSLDEAYQRYRTEAAGEFLSHRLGLTLFAAKPAA
jgi:hypothetical protein